MDVQFVASVAPIVRDTEAARAFYGDALGLSFEGVEGDYMFTQKLAGTKHFGLWPLAEAATACFGTTEWPSDIPVLSLEGLLVAVCYTPSFHDDPDTNT
jgi:catechol 2,3-dioxygenase-like lactoylglutathione lyase family enzyme